jgi:hypothetical protein
MQIPLEAPCFELGFVHSAAYTAQPERHETTVRLPRSGLGSFFGPSVSPVKLNRAKRVTGET